MRKEIVWTGIIGISFGLIVAFGLYRINSSLKTKTSSTTNTPTPEIKNSEFKITLDKPNNNDVVVENIVKVSGITKPLTLVTVSGEKGDYIIQTNEQGAFIQDVDLISGVNQIKLTAFDPAGNQSVQKVLVVFSSAFQPKTVSTITPTDNSTESAIRQKVAQDIAKAMNQPKAYIGTVTDIADTTIQIKTAEGEIKQIATAGVTTVIDTSPTVKMIKLTDIAIGDFIVGMGYINSATVLEAQRILITDPVTEPKINAFFGKVASVSKKSITVTSLKDGQDDIVTPSSKTDIEIFTSGKVSASKLANINEGDTVVHIAVTGSDTPTIRTIFVLSP